MRSFRSKGDGRAGNKTQQVCALTERALSLAMAASDDELLQSLQVVRVIPAPSVARLLVVVQPVVELPHLDSTRILDTLEARRGYLRSELASELNRKKTPELSFTIGMLQVSDDVPSDGTAAAASHWPSATEPPAPWQPSVASSAGHAHRTKRERPRNQKRALKRQARAAERRTGTTNAPLGATADAQAGQGRMPALHDTSTPTGGVAVKRWTRGVPVESEALLQLENIARLPVVSPWVAAMPDVHLGKGATVGSVIPTRSAIIPAAVGVDIGCGMMAVRTTLVASQLPDSLGLLRSQIERTVPHGRGKHGGRGDIGSWDHLPAAVASQWHALEPGFEYLADKHPALRRSNHAIHLGTLGTGNHFIELCLDETQHVWVMLHSGSRGVGNRIGTYFIELAKRDMERHLKQLPDKDLAYFSEGSEHFDDYFRAVNWAQEYARHNRELMMRAVLHTLHESPDLPSFQTDRHAVNCHHNYVQKEVHGGESLYITRKGAVSAQRDELGIIPGSMGARSFIVRGKGNPDSFCSCSHGAGRRMSRTQAKARFTLDDHRIATEGVECRKDRDVLDETPRAYKDIEAVMAAQQDLVEIEHTLKQVLCVKG